MDDGVEMGPTSSDRRVSILTELVEDARAKGATVVTGGAGHGDKGYFFQPTVLLSVPDTARIMQEEPFSCQFPGSRYFTGQFRALRPCWLRIYQSGRLH